MLKKLSYATFGLVLACASQTLAGSTGNGWAQTSKSQYAFCYAGNPKVVYFSRVITLAPKVSAPNLGVAYATYVKTKYGLPSIDRQRCVTAGSSVAAEDEKHRYKGMFGTTRLIDTQWAGKSSGTQ